MFARLCAVLLALALLAAVGAYLTGTAAVIVDLRAAGFVLGVPVLFTLATRGAREFGRSAHVAFVAPSPDLPAVARTNAASMLRGLAGQSLAAGLLVLFAGALRHLGSVATAGGSVTPADLWAPFGGLLLAPVYGLVLATFVYAPLADALAADGEDGLDASD